MRGDSRLDGFDIPRMTIEPRRNTVRRLIDHNRDKRRKRVAYYKPNKAEP